MNFSAIKQAIYWEKLHLNSYILLELLYHHAKQLYFYLSIAFFSIIFCGIKMTKLALLTLLAT